MKLSARFSMPRHHVVITGTGRTGTTFLVQLFTVLGLDTGFKDPMADFHENCNAGMEWDLRWSSVPYIVKSPAICDYLDGLLDEGDVIIDHAIIPIRDLYAAAESRREVSRKAYSSLDGHGVNGGLWGTEDPGLQEGVLGEKFHKLIYTLVANEIPLTFLLFPKFIHEPGYLYERLGFLLCGIEWDAFLAAYEQVVRPEIVHDYNWRSVSIPAPPSDGVADERVDSEVTD